MPRKPIHKLTPSDQPKSQTSITSFFGSSSPNEEPEEVVPAPTECDTPLVTKRFQVTLQHTPTAQRRETSVPSDSRIPRHKSPQSKPQTLDTAALVSEKSLFFEPTRVKNFTLKFYMFYINKCILCASLFRNFLSFFLTSLILGNVGNIALVSNFIMPFYR